MRQVVHWDGDAFFASVEQAADPRLRGRPMAVGGLKRGVISSASYEARAKGVKTAMATSRALQVCPGLIVLPGRYRLYEEFSSRIFGLCEALTPEVEKSSIDEGYMEFTGYKEGAELVELMRAFQARVETELQVTISVGIATNKLVASVASKLRKPRGFVVVPPGEEAAFFAPIAMERLPGIGPKTEAALRQTGARTLGDLVALGVPGLRPVLGRHAEGLLAAALGQDDEPVSTQRAPAKSYSQQHTFEHDQRDLGPVQLVLKRMLDELLEDLRRDAKQARTITVRVRFPDMEDASVSRSIDEPSDLAEDFYPLVEPLLSEGAGRRRAPLRLAGVKLANLYDAVEQTELFSQDRTRKRDLARAVDKLNVVLGKGALKRACHLDRPESGG